MMKREKARIKQRFDPWHLARSVHKDLVAPSKKRECSDVVSWIASVVNHLWWCVATSLGDELFAKRSGSQSFTTWPAFMNGLISNYFVCVAMMNLPLRKEETKYGMETETIKGCLPSCRFCTKRMSRSLSWLYGEEIREQVAALFLQRHGQQNAACGH